MARMFCLSLTRSPEKSDINVGRFSDIMSLWYCHAFIHIVVVSVVGKVHQSERFKYQVTLECCKAKLTEFHSEERRKVNGKQQD